MAIKTFNRYVLKFLITKAQFKELLPLIQPHLDYDEHCTKGEFYPVYSIYFDDETDEIIRNSIAKPFYKEKLRIRSYKIPTSLNDLVFIEIKKKVGKLNNKRRAILPLQVVYDLIAKGKKPDSNEYLNKQIIEEISFFLKNHTVEPKVFLRYERLAFTGKEDKNLRITFDCNLRSRRDNVLLEKGDYGTPIIEDDKMVLEVKHVSAIPMWLTRALSHLNLYKQSFSKYGTEYQKRLVTSKKYKKAKSAA